MNAPKRIVFTLDLEDHRPHVSYPKRYPDITRTLLDFFDERKIEATVFVLGRVAREDPGLIREISQRGHEIGFHSPNHVHLTAETPERFRMETENLKKYLEDLCGDAVVGYRAPAFSLTRHSLWAVDILQELGFSYSSSLLPAKNPIFGFPGAPRQPFRWSNGLLEIPAPVARIGRVAVPFLGGVYLRYTPRFFVQYFLARGAIEQCYWTYCHPYDFDNEEAFFRIDGASLPVSLLLWFNRKNTLKKLESIFRNTGTGVYDRCFATLIGAGEFRAAPIFDVS